MESLQPAAVQVHAHFWPGGVFGRLSGGPSRGSRADWFCCSSQDETVCLVYSSRTQDVCRPAGPPHVRRSLSRKQKAALRSSTVARRIPHGCIPFSCAGPPLNWAQPSLVSVTPAPLWLLKVSGLNQARGGLPRNVWRSGRRFITTRWFLHRGDNVHCGHSSWITNYNYKARLSFISNQKMFQ